MRLEEQGKIEQASSISLHVERLTLICQQRAEAATKREDKASKFEYCLVYSLFGDIAKLES